MPHSTWTHSALHSALPIGTGVVQDINHVPDPDALALTASVELGPVTGVGARNTVWQVRKEITWENLRTKIPRRLRSTSGHPGPGRGQSTSRTNNVLPTAHHWRRPNKPVVSANMESRAPASHRGMKSTPERFFRSGSASLIAREINIRLVAPMPGAVRRCHGLATITALQDSSESHEETAPGQPRGHP